jgi:hypothetical protein
MNNTKKHTPGPWQAVLLGGRVAIIDEINGLPIADFYYRANGEFHNEAYANAIVSSAAPELLQAAKDVCGLLFSLDNVPDDHPTYQALKEAIKKAQP